MIKSFLWMFFFHAKILPWGRGVACSRWKVWPHWGFQPSLMVGPGCQGWHVLTRDHLKNKGLELINVRHELKIFWAGIKFSFWFSPFVDCILLRVSGNPALREAAGRYRGWLILAPVTWQTPSIPSHTGLSKITDILYRDKKKNWKFCFSDLIEIIFFMSLWHFRFTSFLLITFPFKGHLFFYTNFFENILNAGREEDQWKNLKDPNFKLGLGMLRIPA